MKILALDIGGTSIKAASWTDGKLSAITEHDTGAKLGGEQVMRNMAGILEGLGDCDAIGISTTGQIDSQRGIVRYANGNMPDYSGIEIGLLLEKRFHVPVTVENDVNAAAVGEGIYGAAKGYENYLCLTYGTGVGGAVVIGGKLFKGALDAAGEVGSMITHGQAGPKGELFLGHYEDYASTKALILKAQSEDASITNGRQLFARLEEPVLKQIVEDWIWEISHGLVTLIHIFNPSCIVLGGGVMSQDYVADRVREVTKSRVMPCFKQVEFRQARLGNAAGLWGILHLALQKTKEEGSLSPGPG